MPILRADGRNTGEYHVSTLLHQITRDLTIGKLLCHHSMLRQSYSFSCLIKCEKKRRKKRKKEEKSDICHSWYFPWNVVVYSEENQHVYSNLYSSDKTWACVWRYSAIALTGSTFPRDCRSTIPNAELELWVMQSCSDCGWLQKNLRSVASSRKRFRHFICNTSSLCLLKKLVGVCARSLLLCGGTLRCEGEGLQTCLVWCRYWI